MLDFATIDEHGNDVAFDITLYDSHVEDTQVSKGSATTRYLAAHQHLFYEADEATHCYEVLDGAFCVYKLLPDGRRYIVTFAMAGDLVGFGDEEFHSLNAEAISESTVRPVAFNALDHAIVAYPGLAQKLLQHARHELASAREQLVTVARKSALEKVATFLVKLSERNGKRGEDTNVVSLPMTRSDIADFLGLTLETVSRTLSKLKRNGIINLPRSSTVVICDMDELEYLAEV